MSLEIRSPSFQHGAPMPEHHSLDADNRSPPLEWTGVPPGTQSLALVVEDPDAPDPAAPQRIWVHWVVYDLPPDTTSLPEGASGSSLPKGAREGLNDWKKPGYGGPQPPIGRHRYFHKLYALDTKLPDLGTPTRAQLEKAMQGHVLAEAEIVGTFAAQ